MSVQALQINKNATLQITPIKKTEKFVQRPMNKPKKDLILQTPKTPSQQNSPQTTQQNSPPSQQNSSTQQINNLTKVNPISSMQRSTGSKENIPIVSNVPNESIPSYLPKDNIQENILNLNIQKLVTLSLKAMMDTIADLTILYNSNRLTIMNVLSIVLKDNRIMYLGTGFFMVSVAMYIFNNFLRIPSFGFGGIGERRVFINNY